MTMRTAALFQVCGWACGLSSWLQTSSSRHLSGWDWVGGRDLGGLSVEHRLVERGGGDRVPGG